MDEPMSPFHFPALGHPNASLQPSARSGTRPTINTRPNSRLLSKLGVGMTPPLTPLTPLTPGLMSQSMDEAPSDYEPSFHNYLRAFYHFHPTSPVSSVAEESSITVPINQGDVILVHSIQPNGWADGTLLTSGARGWLPTNYCEAYDHDIIRNLLTAMTNVWEFIRGHEDGEVSVFAKQDYVRGMIAGVRVFLERAKCLNRDSHLVQHHVGLRRMRKGLLGDLSSFVKAARLLQELCHGPLAPESLYDLLDDIVLKAFKVVTRAVRFLDVWTQDVFLKQVVQGNQSNRGLPTTPPADLATPETPNPNSLLVISTSFEDQTFQNPAPTTDTTPRRPLSHCHLPPSDYSEGLVTRRASALFAPTSAVGGRPASVVTKRASVSHRWSHSVKSPGFRNQAFASERLCNSHDAFLGSLGAYIGLHMQSRWSMDLLVTTQQSVTACQSLLAVVDEVWERDGRRSESLENARESMHERLAELVQATRDVFKSCEANDETEVFMPDQGRRLVDAATLCVRSAGECVAKTKSVIERIGDFEFEPIGLGISADNAPAAIEQNTPTPQSSRDAAAAEPDHGFEPVSKLLPPPPPPTMHEAGAGPGHSEDLSEPLSLPPAEQRDAGRLSFDDVPMPAPLRTASRALREGEGPRSSSETVVPHDRRASMVAPSRKPPSLDIEIPHVSELDFSESSKGQPVTEKVIVPPRIESIGASATDSNSTYNGSFRSSEQSLESRPSTRATTPDSEKEQSPDSLQSSFSHLADSRENLADESEDAADEQFLAKTYAHELVFNKDGAVSGGSLPALVERLTTHDSTPDAIFVNTFYLTFRLFTTPTDFAQALIDRFEFAGDGQEFATPVRLRVYNVLKGWLESHWQPETDVEALRIILHFATGRLQACLPSASKRLIELTAKATEQDVLMPQRVISTVGKSSTAGTIVALPDGPAPSPIVTRSQMNLLKNARSGGSCSILDFDALELARQFTLIESKIFCSIQPEELLALEWTKKCGSKAVNVKAMSTLSTHLANLVADTILQLEEPKKRAVVIKQWVKIAKKCLELNNYDSLMAIICSLNSSMVLRLKRTWDCVSPKTIAKLEDMKSIVDVSKNYAVLRQRLQGHVAPCLPFVGIYLTDLTFVDVGNQSTRQLSNAGIGECASVINFDKHFKTARIIGDLQRFQIPFKLIPVPEMQEWMESQIHRMRDSEQANVQHYYRRSLMLEPREANKLFPPKLSPIESSSSSFSQPTSAKPEGIKEKFDFWNLHFATHAGSKEKVSS